LAQRWSIKWFIFFNADFIQAEASLQNVLPRLIRGARIVAAPSYCVVAEDVKPILETRIDKTDGALSIASREMARLALDHRHNTVRANTVNERDFHARYATQFYRRVDEDTLLGHQMPVAIVAMRPERYVREPNSYWDQGLMKEFCPESVVDIIGDSDDFLMIELREREVAKDAMLPGPGGAISPRPRHAGHEDVVSARFCFSAAYTACEKFAPHA
jgi:hypothetical protein